MQHRLILPLFFVASTACGPGATPTSPCSNGVQDPGETGVDCGGECGQCAGSTCDDGTDCTSGVCAGGLCVEARCDDGVRNGGETGVDCGGACAGCAVTPTCADGAQNGSETGVDCGGACAPCASAGATCSDGVHNQDESDIDCGGDLCPLCGEAEACRDGGDCASNRCVGGVCAAPLPTCQNATQDPEETDVDCGGLCGGCATGRGCDDNDDCLSRTCTFGVCRDPSCTDAIANQGESDVDCGGPCPSCADGRACRGNADCASSVCFDGACLAEGGSVGECGSERDCPAGSYCEWKWNREDGAAAGVVTECLLEDAGAAPGSPCAEQGDCAGWGCVNHYCSAICAGDADCGAGALCVQASMHAENNVLYEPVCMKQDNPGASCLASDDCGADQRCNIFVVENPGEPAEGPRVARGRCEDGDAGGAAGAICDYDKPCASGVCEGYRCTEYCDNSDQCEPITVNGQTEYRHCELVVLGDAAREDEADAVYVGACFKNAEESRPEVLCVPRAGGNVECGTGNSCQPRPLAWGPDLPGAVEWFCIDAGYLPEGNPCFQDSQCESKLCFDVGAGQKCVAPCTTSGECATGSCGEVALVPRAGQYAANAVTIGVCR